MSKPIRILFLEDSTSDIELLHVFLEKNRIHYQFECVENISSYEAALDGGGWDIILADYSLPQFSGLEALEIKNKRNDDTPLIIVSGTVGEDVAVECMRSGAKDYVLKSNLKRLPQAIMREIEQSAIRTELKQAEKSLDSQIALINSIIKYSPALISVTDVDGNIVLVNDRFSVLGYHRPEELVSRNVYTKLDSDIQIGIRSENEEIVRNGIPKQIIEKIKHYTGKEHTYLTLKFPITDAHGVTCCIGSISSDITEQLEADEERGRLEKQLLTAQKMESIALLTGGIAHDFNNVLTVMLGFNDLIKRKIKTLPHNSDIEHYTNQIYLAGHKASELVKNMLTYARGDSNRVETVRMRQIITKVLDMATSTIPATITIHFSDTPGINDEIKANVVQMQQMIMNIIINARDAMACRGELSISLAHANIKNKDKIYCDSCCEPVQGEYIELFIGDSGQGIKKENISKIFDPFYTTKELGKGSGLGLSIVHGIVHGLGGHILVDSIEGSGTRFRILIPQIQNHVTSDVPRTQFTPGTSSFAQNELTVDQENRIEHEYKY